MVQLLQLHAGLIRVELQRGDHAHRELQHQDRDRDLAQPARAGIARPDHQGQGAQEGNQQQRGEQHRHQPTPRSTCNPPMNTTTASTTVST